MGCVSSTLLNRDEEFPQIGGFSHHIVSLTSTTYGGLLTLDNPPPSSDPPKPAHPQPLETINSWDLMSGLDSDDHVPSFRYLSISNDENADPNVGVSRAVLYVTSLRGVRKTFEDCEAVRSAIRGLGIPFCERDISMDRGFRDELRELMRGKGEEREKWIPPRLFVNGKYVGGVEEVMKIVEQGSIAKLLQGLPLPRSGQMEVVRACEGCGGVGFLPCYTCHGSCKIVKEGFGVGGMKQQRNKRSMVLRCSDCNENGLVICPVCC